MKPAYLMFMSRNKELSFFIASATLLLLPIIAFAGSFSDFKSFVDLILGSVLNPFIIVIFGFAAVCFLWGVAKYILHADDAKAREEGRNMMIYGIIGLFVMVSVWGLVNMLVKTFNFTNNTTLPSAESLVN